MSSITRFLPKNHLSYLIGKIVHFSWPRPINNWIIHVFAKAYHINLDEAEKTIDQYPSLGEFFIRRLKSGVRPLATGDVVHPADSVVTQASAIKQGQLIQAKDKLYSVESFTRDPQALKKWDQGFFATYYLCPTDYHRVHSPMSGKIKQITYIPGALWPVNSWSTQNIHELFSVNERVLVEIETNSGLIGVVFVGATNVGQIELSFDSQLRTNQLLSSAIQHKQYDNLEIQKGDELGMFRMGSTVVMLYSQSVVQKNSEFFENLSRKVPSSVKVRSAF